jgi:hypothetical protein
LKAKITWFLFSKFHLYSPSNPITLIAPKLDTQMMRVVGTGATTPLINYWMNYLFINQLRISILAFYLHCLNLTFLIGQQNVTPSKKDCSYHNYYTVIMTQPDLIPKERGMI